jgi:DNA-directed RNA polymerase specialized sigma24 family protein
MYSDSSSPEVHRLAAELYADKRAYLLRIAERNAASAADAEEATQDAFTFFLADYDPAGGAHPLAWLTTTVKRRAWRLRDNAHLDRRVVALPETRHEEPTGLIERRPANSPATAERVAERDEARRRLARLKRDERRALILKAAGYSYEEIGRQGSWSRTKTNKMPLRGPDRPTRGARALRRADLRSERMAR